MIKSVKMQLKSKDTDIQRLNIKIKRLEKTAEIRENVITDKIDNQTRSVNNKSIAVQSNNALRPSPRQ